MVSKVVYITLCACADWSVDREGDNIPRCLKKPTTICLLIHPLHRDLPLGWDAIYLLATIRITWGSFGTR